MKTVIAILQNAWGDRARLTENPIFKPNAGNHSAKKIRSMIADGDELFFCNACSHVSDTATAKPKADFKHMEQVEQRLDMFFKLRLMTTDKSDPVFLVCGDVAAKAMREQKTFLQTIKKIGPVFFLPHPSARNISKPDISVFGSMILANRKAVGKIFEAKYHRIDNWGDYRGAYLLTEQ